LTLGEIAQVFFAWQRGKPELYKRWHVKNTWTRTWKFL